MSNTEATSPPDPTAVAAAAAEAEAAVVAAAAEATVAATLPVAAVPHADVATATSNTNPSNKWSKNGYGSAVTSKQSGGKFSKEESELVRQSVQEYCAAKQISTARLCSECDHKAELKGAWMEIAKRLPHRSVQSVYRHGIRQLHPFKRGAWSDAECSLLVELVARLGKKWSAIQGKLHRSADACRDKYREMSDDYVKGRWKDDETELLKRLIREQLGIDDMNIGMVALGRMVEEQEIQIPWSAISKRMGKRSRLSCFKKWQKLTGMFPTEGGGEGVLTHAEAVAAGAAGAEQDEPPYKRLKTEQEEHHSSVPPPPSAGQAAAAAAAAVAAGAADYDMYSAKMADETVEAVGLPDTDALPTVREI